MKKEKTITEKYLEKSLSEYSQIVISAVDEILTKRLKAIEERSGLKFGFWKNEWIKWKAD